MGKMFFKESFFFPHNLLGKLFLYIIAKEKLPKDGGKIVLTQ